jgi:hypothetical protein
LDSEDFVDLLAKWVAACDQPWLPFTAVNAPEFREMLEYAYRTPFYIPRDQAVKDRIIKMSDAMKKGLVQIFKVISS